MHREFRASSKWRFLPGAAYGLQQAALLGYFHVAMSEHYDFQPLDAAMERFILELTPKTAVRPSTTLALACRVAHWTISVQRQHKIPVSTHYHLRLLKGEEGTSDTYFVALPSSTPQAAEAALKWVCSSLEVFLGEESISLQSIDQAQEGFELLASSLKPFSLPGQNAIYIHQAALDMDIPIRPVANGIVCLGHGRSSRWLRSTISDQTSSLGVEIAHDKIQTATVLRRAGLPAPMHARARTPEEAVLLAQKLGYPVVIKPSDQEQGRGVSAGLRHDKDVVQAFSVAARFSKSIIVEKHFEGDGHRLTVSHGRVITATKKRPGGVTGDGIQTVEELVAMNRLQPDKRELHAPVRPPLQLDDEARSLLAQYGLTPSSVPMRDQYICLRRRNNAASGGKTIVLSLDQVHPDNLNLATSAAAALRLDIAGVDLLMTDISTSWMDVGALICEVNAAPQMGQNPIFKVLTDLVGHTSRIPVNLAVFISEAAIPEISEISKIAADLGCNGLATNLGVWVNRNRVTGVLRNSFQAATILLNCRDATSALCVMSQDDILAFGLPTDYFDSIRIFDHAYTLDHKSMSKIKMINMIHGHTSNFYEVQI